MQDTNIIFSPDSDDLVSHDIHTLVTHNRFCLQHTIHTNVHFSELLSIRTTQLEDNSTTYSIIFDKVIVWHVHVTNNYTCVAYIPLCKLLTNL